MKTFHVEKSADLNGHLKVPGDKSISHRAMMFASLAEGVSTIRGFLQGEDTLATANIFAAMGVRYERNGGTLTVYGVGMDGLRQPDGDLDCGNSGTAMRLLTGLLAGTGLDLRLIGDKSLMTRPMERVALPLRQMGADIRLAEEGRPPVDIKPSPSGLQGIHYTLPVASAQVKSAVLLAGLYAKGITTVVEPKATRDHTEKMLPAFACPVMVDGQEIRVEGGVRLLACDIDVPADVSSAAFFLVAASIIPGSDLVLENVGMNPRRNGIVSLLRLMGADIETLDESMVGGEPVATLRVRHSALNGIEIPDELIANAIDEFPVLFVAAAHAEGETILRGAEELRVKESDRLAVMAAGLKQLGVNLEEFADGIRISGRADYKPVKAEVNSHGDHRCAMALAVAGMAGEGAEVLDCENVETSFPGFDTLMASINGQIMVAG